MGMNLSFIIIIIIIIESIIEKRNYLYISKKYRLKNNVS